MAPVDCLVVVRLRFPLSSTLSGRTAVDENLRISCHLPLSIDLNGKSTVTSLGGIEVWERLTCSAVREASVSKNEIMIESLNPKALQNVRCCFAKSSEL